MRRHHSRQRPDRCSPARASRASRRLLAIFCCGLLLVTTGCTTLPSNTPPQSLGQFRRSTIAFVPPQPAPNRSPDLLLRDYLRASAVPTNRHAAARAFLTPEANKKWSEHTTFTIVERVDVNTVASPNDHTVILQARVRSVGEVSETGTFSSRLSTDTYEVKMVKNGRQWYVDSLPDALLIDRDAFMSTYESQSIYFLDPSGTRVVPDPRWIYSQDASLPTVLMGMLTSAPSPQLRNVVATELPPSARVSAVAGVQGNGVDIEITNYTVGSEASRQRLAAQIIFTFERARVHGPYYITINGDDLSAHQQKWHFSTVRHFDPMYQSEKNPVELHAITADGLVKVGPSLTPVKGELGHTAELRYAAYSRGGAMLAAVANVAERSKDPMVLKVGRAQGRMVDALRGATLSRPTWSPNGRDVWTVRNRKHITAVRWQDSGSTETIAVDTSRIGSPTQINAFQLSPDGVRAAYINADRLYTCVVVMQRDGSIALTNAQRVFVSPTGPIISVSWRSAHQLLVGGSQSDRPVLLLSLDGAFASPLGARNVTAPVSLVVGNSTGIYAQDSRDVMRLEQGSEGYWQDVPALVSSPRAIPVLEG